MSTDLFIRRPVMTTLLMAGILVFGIMAYRLLPVSDLPHIDFPTNQVTARISMSRTGFRVRLAATAMPSAHSHQAPGWSARGSVRWWTVRTYLAAVRRRLRYRPPPASTTTTTAAMTIAVQGAPLPESEEAAAGTAVEPTAALTCSVTGASVAGTWMFFTWSPQPLAG